LRRLGTQVSAPVNSHLYTHLASASVLMARAVGGAVLTGTSVDEDCDPT
jgi:hypothetical protein